MGPPRLEGFIVLHSAHGRSRPHCLLDSSAFEVVDIPGLPTGCAQQLVRPRLHLSEEPLALYVVLMDFQFFQQGHEEPWRRLCYLVFNPEPGADVPANSVQLVDGWPGIHVFITPRRLSPFRSVRLQNNRPRS